MSFAIIISISLVAIAAIVGLVMVSREALQSARRNVEMLAGSFDRSANHLQEESYRLAALEERTNRIYLQSAELRIQPRELQALTTRDQGYEARLVFSEVPDDERFLRDFEENIRLVRSLIFYGALRDLNNRGMVNSEEPEDLITDAQLIADGTILVSVSYNSPLEILLLIETIQAGAGAVTGITFGAYVAWQKATLIGSNANLRRKVIKELHDDLPPNLAEHPDVARQILDVAEHASKIRIFELPNRKALNSPDKQ